MENPYTLGRKTYKNRRHRLIDMLPVSATIPASTNTFTILLIVDCRKPVLSANFAGILEYIIE